MWLKWLPWRFAVSRLARSHGFLDPVALWARVRRFAQPSEVAEPIELLRAGMVFHARGLINSRAIQHNLDWVWPFWVERQFDPHDEAFTPRAFSITHINLTHRNWTAVGRPDVDQLPIVDPRGLLTPHFDGWSLDVWIVPEDGEPLIPSRTKGAVQQLLIADPLAVSTRIPGQQSSLRTKVTAVDDDGSSCRMQVIGDAQQRAWLALAIRPVNPEGVSFIHEIRWNATDRSFSIDQAGRVELDRAPDRVRMSDYHSGDVFQLVQFSEHHDQEPDQRGVRCDVGMATAAALYRLEPAQPLDITIRVPLHENASPAAGRTPGQGPAGEETAVSWAEALRGSCELRTPDPRLNFLFDAAVRSLVLHSPRDVYPGPYTYRRFWFRDAAFIIHALLALGLSERALRTIARFPSRQTRLGYFRSQEGEWDSNGQVLWIMQRFRQWTGQPLPDQCIQSAGPAARWIMRKRTSVSSGKPHAGLMPAGFSAEHFGPNDYYYWDNFWSVAGLRAAAELLGESGSTRLADESQAAAGDLMRCVERSLEETTVWRDRPGVPASPYRRMDSGAIGALVAGYPLQLWPARDPRLLETTELLLDKCMVRKGFFQDMTHSGINAYLTLHLAQILLRAGDPRSGELVRAVGEMASATGQWPEAIHPRTGGGCMGDGQHVWASAEWVLALRSCFLMEENDRLVLGAGLPAEWLETNGPVSFGRTPTKYGNVRVTAQARGDTVHIVWDARWRDKPPTIEVRLPGRDAVVAPGDAASVAVT